MGSTGAFSFSKKAEALVRVSAFVTGDDIIR